MGGDAQFCVCAHVCRCHSYCGLGIRGWAGSSEQTVWEKNCMRFGFWSNGPGYVWLRLFIAGVHGVWVSLCVTGRE